MPKTLLDLPGEGQNFMSLESGVSPALFPASGFIWFDAENVVFKDGGPQSMKGWLELVQVGRQVRQLEQAFIDAIDSQRVYIGTDSQLFLWQAPSGLVQLGDSYTSSAWSFVTFGTWLLATNGVDTPQIWKNDLFAPAVDMTVPFDWAKIFRKLGPHIIAMNTSTNGAEIAWSSADDPDDWTPTPINSAGDLIVRDLESDIITAEYIADRLAIYSKDGMALLANTGFPFYFGQERVLDNIGAVGLNAVASVGRLNYGMGFQGIWVTDGFRADYIDSPAIRSFLEADLNQDAVDKVVAYNDEAEQQVIWYYPSGSATENDAGIGYNYQNGAWTRYDFGRSAAVPRVVFNYPLTGDDNSVYEQGNGLTANGEDIISWVQSRPLDMKAPELFKRIQLIRLHLEQSGTLNLSLGEQTDLSDAVSFFYDEAAQISNYIPDRETPFLTVKLLGTGANWKLSGFRIGGEAAGGVI